MEGRLSMRISSINTINSDNVPLFLGPKFSTKLLDTKIYDETQAALKSIGVRVSDLLQEICLNSDFPKKYDLYSYTVGEPFLFLLSTFNSPYKYSLEAFPKVIGQSAGDLNKGPEVFRFHETLEAVIQRYTNFRSKPNMVLQETRSTDFCYSVTIHIEAVPLEKAKKPKRMLLIREYQVLVAIWEQYLQDLKQKNCASDQLVGFPMPFEFCCVTGTEYDVPEKSIYTYNYYNLYGALTDFKTNFKMPMSTTTVLNSTLSYMSVEKLGPSVTYLMDLMRYTSKPFSLSSALKIYDQLICRLMILHRYGIIHGDLNTDCLRFGSRNACNVLYISEFSTCVAVPSKYTPDFLFHDRFVSSQRVKDRIFHFIHDLESAFYIFFLLVVGQLPWDNKIKLEARVSLPLMGGIEGVKETNPISDRSNTQKDKETFWDSPVLVQRIVNTREYEIEGSLYSNFVEDLMLTLHQKMKEILSCVHMDQVFWWRDISNSGSATSNAYLGLRKTIASYFRFETLNPFLKDSSTEAKIGMLMSLDPVDRRAAWDLSNWCWNSISVEKRQNQNSVIGQYSLVNK